MSDNENLLGDWLVRAKRKTNAHACCATRCDRLHQAIGVPLVAVSAVTGTAVVAQQMTADASEWKWWVVALVVASAVLTSVQSFLNCAAKAERHKAASAGFSSLRRRIQRAIDQKRQGDQAEIDRLGEIFDELMASEPIIPASVWRTVEKKYPRS